jgi:DoxX-like family
MFLATVIVTVLLAALMAYAAVRKLSRRPEVVGSYARVGVPEERLNLLAFTLLAGAGGLLLGLAWQPLGIAAAISAVVYFLVAIAAHVRSEDLEQVPAPIVMELFAIGAAVLRITA